MAHETAPVSDRDPVLTDAPQRRRRRSGSSGVRGSRQHRRIRLVYFSLASMVGFVIGSAAMVGGIALFDPSFRPGPGLAVLLLVAAAIALAAGALIALLYRGALGRKGLKTPLGRR